MSSNRILFFGTLGIFSHAVLSRLIKHKTNIVGAIIPGATPFQGKIDKFSTIPVLPQQHQPQQLQHETIELLAIKHDIETHYVNEFRSEKTAAIIKSFAPDFIVIACFPYILPKDIFSLANIAALNIHPSQLPAYRGPTPIFWQLQNGEERFYVTIHKLSTKIDSGNIIACTDTKLRDGMRGRAIDVHLGELGAKLLINTLGKFAKNSIIPRLQDPGQASYKTYPTLADFELFQTWTSRRAFNFMRGTDEWDNNYKIVLQDREFKLVSAIAYSPAGTLENNYKVEDNVVTIQFAQGLLKASLV